MNKEAELQQKYAYAVSNFNKCRTEENWLRVASLEWRMEKEKRNAAA